MLVSVDNMEIIRVPSLISEVVPNPWDWAFSNLPSSKLSTTVANLSSDTNLTQRDLVERTKLRAFEFRRNPQGAKQTKKKKRQATAVIYHGVRRFLGCSPRPAQ